MKRFSLSILGTVIEGAPGAATKSYCLIDGGAAEAYAYKRSALLKEMAPDRREEWPALVKRFLENIESLPEPIRQQIRDLISA